MFGFDPVVVTVRVAPVPLPPEIVSPFANPLGGILCGGFKVKDFLSKGANLLDKLKDPFGCKGKGAAPIATDSYVIDGGEKKSKSSFKQQGLLDKAFGSCWFCLVGRFKVENKEVLI